MTATPQSESAPSAATPATSDRKVVIKCAALTKVFKDFWMRPRVRAVNNIDLEIHEGQVFGLLGPNGSGKSTTIKMILGLLHPTSGRIAVLGHRPEDVSTKKDIGYLPEESYLYRFLNARETLDYYGRLFHQPRRTRRARIDMLLEMVGLEAAQNRPVGEYSKGMQRRIGIAQALINDPKLLILDEPTTGMDPIGTRQIKDLLIRLRERGKTILLCSHLLADVEDVCDRVSIMFGGKVVANGTLDELLVDQQTTTLQTEDLDDETLAQVEKVLEQHGKHIGKVSRPRQTLENKFLDLVHAEQSKGSETSGAKSGGKIAGFLMDGVRSGHMPEDVEAAELLNQLTAPTSNKTDDGDADATGATAEVDRSSPAAIPTPAQPVIDEGVLSELSEPKPAAGKVDSGGPASAKTPKAAIDADADADLSVLDGLVVPSAPVPDSTTRPSTDAEAAPVEDAARDIAAPEASDTKSPAETAGETTSDLNAQSASSVNAEVDAAEVETKGEVQPEPVPEPEVKQAPASEPASTLEPKPEPEQGSDPEPKPNPAPAPVADAEEPPPPLVSERSGEAGTNLADAVEVDDQGHEVIKPKPDPTSEMDDVAKPEADEPAPRVSESGEKADEGFMETMRNLNKRGRRPGRGPNNP